MKKKFEVRVYGTGSVYYIQYAHYWLFPTWRNIQGWRGWIDENGRHSKKYNQYYHDKIVAIGEARKFKSIGDVRRYHDEIDKEESQWLYITPEKPTIIKIY